jgi:hypothetical protein
MNECLKEQKETEKQLYLAEILHGDKTIEELQLSLKEYEEGLEKTEKVKSNILTDIKRNEVEYRKAVNQEEEQ